MLGADKNLIKIPGTDITTSNIGFGTSGIMGSALTDWGRLRVLEHVLGQGICHFDTAPLYGMGEAELLLGKFIKNKRDHVTIATKYGLEPPFVPRYYRKAAPLVRAVYYRSELVKKAVDSMLSRPNLAAKKPIPASDTTRVAPPNTPLFTKKDMERALHESLDKLKTDYIDIYLLHDCSAQMVNEDVIETLRTFQNQGKVRSFGLATGPKQCRNILSSFPALNGVVQLPSTVFDRNIIDPELATESLLITHSALNQALSLIKSLTADLQVRGNWSQVLDKDLAEPDQLVAFLMARARKTNPTGIVLFSSSKLENIVKTVDAIQDNGLSDYQVEQFALLVQEHAAARL